MRSDFQGMIARVFPIVLAIGLSACSSPPTSSVKTDPAAEQQSSQQTARKESESSKSQGAESNDAYRLQSEGEAPVTKDVEFEEDRLPPSPEEVEAARLEKSKVAPSEVEQMPKVQEEATTDSNSEKIPQSVTAPVEPSVKIPIEGSRPAARRGFRVQIAASGSESSAEEVAREARTRVPETVYVVFESPYYKVRVGDFSDRGLALQLRDRLRGYGYDGAWVVTTTILENTKDSGS